MDPKNIVIGALVAALVYDGLASARNRKKFNALKARNQKLVRAVVDLAEAGDYLSAMLDKHEIPLDEFDQLVLFNIGE